LGADIKGSQRVKLSDSVKRPGLNTRAKANLRGTANGNLCGSLLMCLRRPSGVWGTSVCATTFRALDLRRHIVDDYILIEISKFDRLDPFDCERLDAIVFTERAVRGAAGLYKYPMLRSLLNGPTGLTSTLCVGVGQHRRRFLRRLVWWAPVAHRILCFVSNTEHSIRNPVSLPISCGKNGFLSLTREMARYTKFWRGVAKMQTGRTGVQMAHAIFVFDPVRGGTGSGKM